MNQNQLQDAKAALVAPLRGREITSATVTRRPEELRCHSVQDVRCVAREDISEPNFNRFAHGTCSRGPQSNPEVRKK